MRCGEDAERKKGDPLLGVKKNHGGPSYLCPNMIPLLHCKIGIGYQLLDKLWAIINEHIACYSPGEEAIHASIPVI
jgi:hypothetical protein